MDEIINRLNTIENKLDMLLQVIAPTRPKILLKDFLSTWLAEFRNNVSSSTLYKDTNNINNHIIPALGDYELVELTPIVLQQYINGIGAPRQREHLFVLLKNAMRKASELGYIDSNPLMSVVMPNYESAPTEILTQAELERFLQLAKSTKYYIAFYTLANEGFRPSELLALDKSNLLDRSIHVTHSWNSKEGKACKTKTKYSVREVPYFDNVKELLFSIDTRGRLFPYQLRYIENSFHDIVKSRDFLGDFVPRQRLTLYSLRHTCITRWAESGVHPRVAMKWAGHNNITTTLHYYTHISSDWEQIEVQKTSVKPKKC